MTHRRLTVVVESPARALTLQRLLPRDVAVRATGGHVARLRPGAGGLPALQILRGKGHVLQELRRLSHGGPLLLATDPDREGEAIAWAVATALCRTGEACRVEISALTPDGIAAGLALPRPLDPGRLQAHLARRHADARLAAGISRLAGELLPPPLGLGRVGAVALAMLAEGGPAAAPARKALTTAALLRGAAAANITSARAMAILGRLHDGVPLADELPCGLITYPRTDGVAHGPLRATRPELAPESLPLTRDERRVYVRVHAGDPHAGRPPATLSGEALLLAHMDEQEVGRPSTLGGIVAALRTRSLAEGTCARLRVTDRGRAVLARLAAAAPALLAPELSRAVDAELDAVERAAPGQAAAIGRLEGLVRGALARGSVVADPTGFAAGFARSLP